MMSQKEGTYIVVSAVLKDHGKSIDPKKPVALTAEERAECINRLCSKFSANQISCSREYEPKQLKTYCGGLLSNWLKKDRRLNGDVEFELQNPGSRSESIPPEIREARKLKKQVKGTEKEEIVDSVIEDLLNKHRIAKQKQDINIDQLPAELKSLVS